MYTQDEVKKVKPNRDVVWAFIQALPFLIFIIAFFLIWVTTWNIKLKNPWTIINNNSWSVVIIYTWSINTWWQHVVIDSWEVVPTEDIIPEDPRSYIDYILKNWKAGEDYITIDPTIPPIIRSADKQDNNSVMYSYVRKYSNLFTMPTGKTEWYVMFTTKKEIASNRDFFLAIDGNVRWHIMRNRSLPVFNDNEYLYDIKRINVTQDEWWVVSLLGYIKNGKLMMTAFVWEYGNYVSNITIVFK